MNGIIEFIRNDASLLAMLIGFCSVIGVLLIILAAASIVVTRQENREKHDEYRRSLGLLPRKDK